MEERHAEQVSGHAEKYAGSSGSSPEMARADSSLADDIFLTPRTATAPPRQNQIRSSDTRSKEVRKGLVQGKGFENSQHPGREQAQSIDDAALKGSRPNLHRTTAPKEGKLPNVPCSTNQHPYGNASDGGSPSCGRKGRGGISADAGPSPGKKPGLLEDADGHLLTSSPLRNRFRSTRGGDKGWSSSSALGRGGAGRLAGRKRVRSAAARGGLARERSSWLFSKVFKSCLVTMMRLIRKVNVVIALVALAFAGMGAMLVGCSLYLTVRPWGLATYRRLLCSQVVAPLIEAASLLLPRTRVRVTGDSDMLDGLCPCVIVSNMLPGNLGLDWWSILMVARAVGAHGFTKVLVSDRLYRAPVLGWILRMLEFPNIGDCYQTDREQVKQCMTSFARDIVSASPYSGVPHHFLHFPEGDSLNRDRLTSSLEFAKKEGRPEMMRLLLPHTTVLSACLDALRPAKPVVYNFTLAVAGYSGEISCDRPPNGWEILRSLVSGSMWKNGGGTPCAKLSCSCGHDSGVSHRGIGSGVGGVSERTMEMCSEIPCVCSTRGTTATKPLGFASGSILPTAEASGIGRSLSNDAIGVDEGIDGSSVDGFEGGEGGRRDMWRICQDVHVRIKRYSLEEVMSNTHWLDDRWAEKERLLAYFSRHQGFPSDGRGFPARWILDTQGGRLEDSALALVRLSMALVFVPLLFLPVIPLIVFMGFTALSYRLTSAIIRAAVTYVIPGRLARAILGMREEDGSKEEEEDKTGRDCSSGSRSSLTPWWGCPKTPLNTPAPGVTTAVPSIGNGLSQQGGSRSYLRA